MDNNQGMVIVLSGFSGAGKGTIMKHLLSEHPTDYFLSISATTRGKREGEEDGREYFFKTREVQGALQIRKIFPQALLLFVTPPSGNILKERLEGRGTEEPEVVAQRLAIASRESLLMEQYDYIIVNDDLDKAVSYVHELIQSEHGRTMRNTQLIDRIQNELAVFAKGEVK